MLQSLFFKKSFLGELGEIIFDDTIISLGIHRSKIIEYDKTI